MNAVLEAGVAIYVAMAVALAVWIGIFVYLWRIDAHARELRRRLERLPTPEHAPQPTATLRAQRVNPEASVEQQPVETARHER